LTEIQPFRLYLARSSHHFLDRKALGLNFAKLVRMQLLLAGLLAVAAPARAATVNAQVTASGVKPLILTKVQDLDFGSVTLGPGIWSNATISLSQAGVLSCANANVTCTGATMVAQYNVQGSKQQAVQISAPNVTLVNQSDSSQTLTLVTDAPSSLILANNGFPGSNFSIGGSVSINSTTAAGTYVGTFNVTVDY
jgi:spore coat protein U-like protein